MRRAALVARIKYVLRRTQRMTPIDTLPDLVSRELALHFKNQIGLDLALGVLVCSDPDLLRELIGLAPLYAPEDFLHAGPATYCCG